MASDEEDKQESTQNKVEEPLPVRCLILMVTRLSVFDDGFLWSLALTTSSSKLCIRLPIDNNREVGGGDAPSSPCSPLWLRSLKM